MAIAGSGTQADPWVVTTYTELVSKADDEGYIKIGNDINITDEYPNGDMPTLEIVKSDIDGDGKVISNWYKTDSGYCIDTTDSSDTVSCIHDLTIRNIYIKDSVDAFLKRGDSDTRDFFVNCYISGMLLNPFTDNSSNTVRFKCCSINCDTGDNDPFGSGGFRVDSCYVKFKSTYDGNGYLSDSSGRCGYDSYFELDVPSISGSGYIDRYGNGFDNCVLDIKSNSSFYIGSGSTVSIINSTNAPNAQITGSTLKPVDDTHWLDAAYLASIGFAIAE